MSLAIETNVRPVRDAPSIMTKLPAPLNGSISLNKALENANIVGTEVAQSVSDRRRDLGMCSAPAYSRLPARDASSRGLHKRLKVRLKMLAQTLFGKADEDIWNKHGKVAIVLGNQAEIIREAIIRFDPQCEEDIITTSFLKESFGLTYDASDGERLAYSITGREEYRSVAKCSIRWWTSSVLRYQPSSCHVVESDLFEVIIGNKTITRLGLYQPRRGIIAAFISKLPSVNASTVSEEQEKARLRREKEKRDKEQREKDKKDKRRRDKQNATN